MHDSMCKHVHVCRDWCWITSLITLYFIYWVRISHWIWLITAHPASQITPEILPLPGKCWGYSMELQLPCLPSSTKVLYILVLFLTIMLRQTLSLLKYQSYIYIYWRSMFKELSLGNLACFASMIRNENLLERYSTFSTKLSKVSITNFCHRFWRVLPDFSTAA